MRLSDWLIRNRMTPHDFTHVCGVSQSNLYRIAAGKQRCGPKVAQKIIDATNGEVTLEDLIWPRALSFQVPEDRPNVPWEDLDLLLSKQIDLAFNEPGHEIYMTKFFPKTTEGLKKVFHVLHNNWLRMKHERKLEMQDRINRAGRERDEEQ